MLIMISLDSLQTKGDDQLTSNRDDLFDQTGLDLAVSILQLDVFITQFAQGTCCEYRS